MCLGEQVRAYIVMHCSRELSKGETHTIEQQIYMYETCAQDDFPPVCACCSVYDRHPLLGRAATGLRRVGYVPSVVQSGEQSTQAIHSENVDTHS
jgi:hypothetical protein